MYRYMQKQGIIMIPWYFFCNFAYSLLLSFSSVTRFPLFLDLDECDSGHNDCSTFAQCINTVGSHQCICLNGFSGDGKNCSGKPLSLFRLPLCMYLLARELSSQFLGLFS